MNEFAVVALSMTADDYRSDDDGVGENAFSAYAVLRPTQATLPNVRSGSSLVLLSCICIYIYL